MGDPMDDRRELRFPRVSILLQPREASVAANFPKDALIVCTPFQVVLFHWNHVALFLFEEVLELIADLRRAILTARTRWQPVLVRVEDVTVADFISNPLLREFNSDAMLKPSSELGHAATLHFRIRVGRRSVFDVVKGR